MVALLENTGNISKTAHRARGGPSSTHAPVNLRANSLNRIEFCDYTYADRRRLGSCSKDPIGYEGSKWNLFEYVGSSPVRYFDPSGHECFDMLYCGPYDPPTPTLTPDQKAAYAACAGISGSSCGGCSQSTCEEAVDAFIEAVDDSWILGIPFIGTLGPNTCERKAKDIVKRIPKLEDNPCVALVSVATVNDSRSVHPTRTPTHSWAMMLLCNGTTINGDNGANGGDDEIWVGDPSNNQD